MSRKSTRAVDMPSLPLGAQEEILDMLFSDMRICSDDILKVLKKYEVTGDEEALQDSYRRRVGQRLMASIRDEAGKREVLFGKGKEYVVIECCNDPDQLKAIRHRIESQMEGMSNSIGKVNSRVKVVERFSTQRKKYRRKENTNE